MVGPNMNIYIRSLYKIWIKKKIHILEVEEANSLVESKVGEEVDLHIVVPDFEVKNYTNKAN